MKRYFILATLVAFLGLSSELAFSQEAFLEERISKLVIDGINQLRAKEELHPLTQDETLDAIAFDQAEYILKLGKVVHEQDQEKKKNLLDRIIYYKGLYAEAGENAAQVGVGSKEKIEFNGPRVTIETEENAAKAAIISWIEEEEGRLNLLDPNFYNLGVAVIIDENQEITFVMVAASLPYVSAEEQKNPLNFHGIKPYSEEVCKGFLETHPTLPQLFSDAIKVKEGEAFFEYHSLAYIEELFENSSDGIAIDIISDNQFSCSEGIRLFPTEINDGYLLSPAKRMDFINYNALQDKGEVRVSLGELPSFYNEKDCEMNLIVVKKGHYCETVPYNQIETKDVKWFDVPYLIAGETENDDFLWKDSSTLSIVLDKKGEWKKTLEKQFSYRKEVDYQFSKVDLQLKFLPLIDDTMYLKEVESVIVAQGLPIDYSIGKKESWEEYFEFQKGTFHQLETDGKDTLAIIEYLKAQTDQDLLDFLDSQVKLEVAFEGTATIPADLSNETRIAMFEDFLADQKILPAQYLQAKLIREVLEKKMEVALLPLVDPSQKKLTLPLINNQIIFKQNLGEKVYDGNPIYLAFLELFLVDRSNKEIVFNKYISELKHWSIDFDNISNFQSWEDGFKNLSKSVSAPIYAKALLNYQIIAADYYYEKGDFVKRKKAFLEIMKWQNKANLSDEERLNLAKYLCYQDQFTKAIELLKPMVNKEEVNKAMLFYYLQISIYNREAVSKESYFKSLQKLKQLYPKDFCKLFSKEKMGMQLLGQSNVRALYCQSCEQ